MQANTLVSYGRYKKTQKTMTKNNDRRAVHDRRDIDKGPPAGWADRRRSTERRLPDINESDISEADWEMYFGAKPDESVTPNTPESTADVLGEVRD